jgi:large subunit ribosomal protein L21
MEEDTTYMYAVIRSGGKQYRVTPGQTVRLESLGSEKGAKVQLGNVLLVEDGGKLQTGAALANAKVEAVVVESDRAKKILVFHKKRKKQYRKTRGHRQDFTAVRIEKILV